MTKFQALHEDFETAVGRFEEVLKVEKSNIVRDSAIKRFEMVFDLAWKTIKAFLQEKHNVSCVSPKTCFREAYRVGLIGYDTEWLKLADDRNLTAHTYKEALAERIYGELPAALAIFKNLSDAFQKNRQP